MWHPTNELWQCRRQYKTVQEQLSLAKNAAGDQMGSKPIKSVKRQLLLHMMWFINDKIIMLWKLYKVTFIKQP